MENKGKIFLWTYSLNTETTLLRVIVLGPNFGEESAQRIARSSGITDEILRSVNTDCKILEKDKTRSSTDPSEAVKQIVADLLSINAFVFKPGREGYTSFPKISANLVQGLDYRDLYNWMKTRLNEWAKIYEHQN